LIGKMPVLKSALKDEKMAVLREEEKRELWALCGTGICMCVFVVVIGLV
jgi:hypothetical protein